MTSTIFVAACDAAQQAVLGLPTPILAAIPEAKARLLHDQIVEVIRRALDDLPPARSFYIAHLVDLDGTVLAREEIWSPEAGADIGTPESVALDAAAFFSTDEHDVSPVDCVIRLYGPFLVDFAAPAYSFKVAEPDGMDADYEVTAC